MLLVVPGPIDLRELRRVTGDAVRTELEEFTVGAFIVGEDRATFSGGDVLDRVEAEDGEVRMAASAGLEALA